MACITKFPVKFTGNTLVPPFCKKAVAKYDDQTGEIIGYDTEVNWECLNNLTGKYFGYFLSCNQTETVETDPQLVQCINSTGFALFLGEQGLLLGTTSQCFGENFYRNWSIVPPEISAEYEEQWPVITYGTWTESYEQRDLPQYPELNNPFKPQIGGICTINEAPWIIMEPEDSGRCGGNLPCSRLVRVSCA